jgi:isopentenyl-diphosphate Delta-isomerase
MQTEMDAIVSFDDEPLILVDLEDNVVGHRSKGECHDGQGLLHRAFSVFLFDNDNRVLLQQRADVKRLWPGFWANSCCSHPRRGESIDHAAARRTQEELALSAVGLTHLFKFTYQVNFGDVGAEHELCSVYVARMTGTPRFNRNEIAETKVLEAAELDIELRDNSDAYTPWLKLEWPRLRRDYWNVVEVLPRLQ